MAKRAVRKKATKKVAKGPQVLFAALNGYGDVNIYEKRPVVETVRSVRIRDGKKIIDEEYTDVVEGNPIDSVCGPGFKRALGRELKNGEVIQFVLTEVK